MFSIHVHCSFAAVSFSNSPGNTSLQMERVNCPKACDHEQLSPLREMCRPEHSVHGRLKVEQMKLGR